MRLNKVITKENNVRFEVSGTVNGKFIRKRFKTKDIAERHRNIFAIQKANTANQCTPKITRLSDDQLKEAEAAVTALGNDRNLMEAVEFFKKNYNPSRSLQNLSGAITHFLSFKEKSNRRARTIQSLRTTLRQFEALIGGDTLISEITTAQANSFILSKKNDQTRLHMKRALSNLFNHCIHQGWLMVDIMAFSVKITPESKRPECFPVDDVKLIMEASEAYLDGAFSLYFALAFFAGLRPEAEIERLKWENINLEEGLITIEASKTKTQIRHVRIEENLKQWLKKYSKKQIVPTDKPSQLRAELGEIRQMAGYKAGYTKNAKAREKNLSLKDWISDGARHSYASYLYAKESSLGFVAEQMGSRESTIKRHYKALVKKSDAEKFFSIMPN